MDSKNVRYISSTSEFISSSKPHLRNLGNYLDRMKEEISEMESPKRTKSETKKRLERELSDAYQELLEVAENMVALSNHIQSLARGDKNGRETTQL